MKKFILGAVAFVFLAAGVAEPMMYAKGRFPSSKKHHHYKAHSHKG